MMTTNRVCVLGSSGFIGGHVSAELERRGVPWVGVDRSSDGSKRTYAIRIDETDRIVELLDDYPIVINAMGSFKPKDFTRDFKATMDEFWGAHQRHEAALNAAPVQKVVHVSSAGTVYGESPRCSGSIETDPLRPKSWYGKTKVIEERTVESICTRNEIPFVIARVSNPYGKTSAASHGIVDVLLQHALTGLPFTAAFSDRACRDFIYVHDLGRLLTRLALEDCTGIVNVASGESVSLDQLVTYVEERVEGFEVQRRPYEDNARDVVRSIVSNNKLRTMFNISALRSLFDYLESCLSGVTQTGSTARSKDHEAT